MGRLIRSQKVGEGMFIKGRGKLIEITLSEIIRKGERVRFKVNGIEDLEETEVSSKEVPVELTDDIKLGVGRANKYNLCSKSVHIFYEAPEDYVFNRKEFPTEK